MISQYLVLAALFSNIERYPMGLFLCTQQVYIKGDQILPGTDDCTSPGFDEIGWAKIRLPVGILNLKVVQTFKFRQLAEHVMRFIKNRKKNYSFVQSKKRHVFFSDSPRFLKNPIYCILRKTSAQVLIIKTSTSIRHQIVKFHT